MTDVQPDSAPVFRPRNNARGHSAKTTHSRRGGSPMSIRRRSAAAAGVVISAVALSGCGGRDTSPSADSSSVRQGSSFTPQTADFELTRMGKLGLRQAFFTLTERSDGKTTAVVDFYVPRENGAQDDLYSVSLRTGGCASLGAVEHNLGRLSAS